MAPNTPYLPPLSEEERRRLALASMYPSATPTESKSELAALIQRAAAEDEQVQRAADYQDYMDNRWLLKHYSTMPVPEAWKPFIDADTPPEEQEPTRRRVAEAGQGRTLLTGGSLPERNGPMKAAQVQTNEEAEDAARRAERVKAGKPSLSDLIFHTKYTTSEGMETLPETANRYYENTKDWVKENPVDTASLLLNPVPIAGDVAGVAADIYHYYKNPDDMTWGNLALSALGLVPWVPGGTAMLHAAQEIGSSAAGVLHSMPRGLREASALASSVVPFGVMTKSAQDVRKELEILRLGGQVPVKVGELSADQMREILKVVPKDAGQAFLLTDKMLEATPGLASHLFKRHRDDRTRLLHRMAEFPSKGKIRPNTDPNQAHRPMILLPSSKTEGKYDILIIDAMEEPGKIKPITLYEGGYDYSANANNSKKARNNSGYRK